MSVDYNVLEKFLDIDELELNYHRVTNDINSIDIEDGIEWIFKYYRKKFLSIWNGINKFLVIRSSKFL